MIEGHGIHSVVPSSPWVAWILFPQATAFAEYDDFSGAVALIEYDAFGEVGLCLRVARARAT